VPDQETTRRLAITTIRRAKVASGANRRRKASGVIGSALVGRTQFSPERYRSVKAEGIIT
jgi:hypothetical protein